MSTYSIPLVNNKPPQLTDSAFFADIRYDTDDSAPIYVGLNVNSGEPTANATWKVYKYTYSGSNVTRIQIQYGSWDNRATLPW